MRTGDKIEILHTQKQKKNRVTIKPSNAVIYTRVSSSRQVEGQSLDEQERICRNYCSLNDLNVLKVFREPGGSAFEGRRRKVFESMISFCEKHQLEIYTVVVFKKSDYVRGKKIYYKIGSQLRPSYL